MKLFKTLSIAFVLSTGISHSDLQAASNQGISMYSEIPARTICIKHPAANNLDGFFSTTTTLMFEIYKPGTKEELAKIIGALKKNANVESCVEGPLTGDYQMITLVIKEMKDKQWYAALFKKAGLNTIKINNNPIIEVEKL